MKSNRRDFLKLSGLAGAGLAGKGLAGLDGVTAMTRAGIPEKTGRNHFNMSGYAAPRLDTVRIGFIGLGNRGPGAVARMTHIEGVAINALCDLRPEKVAAVQKSLEGGPHHPAVYTDKPEEWKKLCERTDIDLVYIATPWSLHTPMAVYAMNQGKHVCVEVPAAKTIEECWQLVETSERTRRHCMMLENCCYDFFELLILNMARQGFFGEIIHGEGAYNHDLLQGNFSKTKYYDMWRLKENFRNGNLYPTHGLGPVAQVMNINRGDRMEWLVSVSGRDFMKGPMEKKLAEKDSFYAPFAGKNFGGNINTSTIRTSQGRTIMLQHDETSPNIYSRIYRISGSMGSALKYPLPGKISVAGGEDWLKPEAAQKLEEQYAPPIIKKIGEMAKQLGGHGGMDFLMDWHTIDCLRNGLPLDMDVYDAAAWSAIGPLSESSVANRSNSIDIPDFTAGDWKTNAPVDISMVKGGSTKVIL